jgi:hypothetical protein
MVADLMIMITIDFGVLMLVCLCSCVLKCSKAFRVSDFFLFFASI